MLQQIELRQAVARRLKYAREKAGYISAENFCQEHQLSLEQYLAYEEGRTLIKTSQILDYCKRLRISLRWLMLG